MTVADLGNLVKEFDSTPKMPVLFIGHGNPMNAIEENVFTKGFRQMAGYLPQPKLILVISAHWETRGTLVTAMKEPRTIHDFGGFPPELYQQQYPAPGSPEFAALIKHLVDEVELDHQWGLDHGAWTVLKHLFPLANVPVVSLSLDRGKDAKSHFALGRELAQLRSKGVLILGSGNIVHNLRAVDWLKINAVDYGYDWAVAAQQRINSFILDRNYQALVDYDKLGADVLQSIPTPEHYLPLLYSLAATEADDDLSVFNDHLLAGSLSMTSLLYA
ncbi:MAG: hypothetical protein RL754_236 [Bacteroidota bacterium]|jgi:4,5-DOPA dioxygenase extradiol